MRKHAADNSSEVSLFPFIAVLLCTMGALMVLLVAMTRIGRDKAQQQLLAKRQAQAASADDSGARQAQEQIAQFRARLRQERDKIEQTLRDDKLNLSHLEDHMRRLQDQIAAVKSAAAELVALRGEHYDDRQQAKRELDRLRQLIDDAREENVALKSESGAGKHTAFAIVPYDGPNGTTRRPIMIECRDGELILQPEGVRLTSNDLAPPVRPGNALAAAIRAAQEHLMNLHPEEGTAAESGPYALLLVRPDGINMAGHAREAIECADLDFGVELVEADWELRFPAADPQLSIVEHQAIEQARARQEALAAAAPRAYRFPRLAASGRFDFDNPGGDPYGPAATPTDGFGGQSRGTRRNGAAGNVPFATGQQQGIGHEVAGRDGIGDSRGGSLASTGTGQFGQISPGQFGGAGIANSPGSAIRGTPESGLGARDASGAPGGTTGAASAAGGPHEGAAGVDGSIAAGQQGGAAGGTAGGQPGQGATAVNGSAATTSPMSTAASVSNSMTGSGQAASGGAGLPTSSADGTTNDRGGQVVEITTQQQLGTELAQSRGSNWAVGPKGPAAVPIRRSIQVIVRDDRIAILPELESSANPLFRGREVQLDDSMANHVDEIVTVIQQHVADWGMAGHGLYWRPVLVLRVAPGGQPRAEELSRCLKDSGIEIRSAAAAQHGRAAR